MLSVSLPIPVAFAALSLALLTLWTPRLLAAPYADRWWTVPFAVALAAAVTGGLVRPGGLLVLLVLGVACHAANRATSPAARIATHAVMLATCAGLLLHVIPGFDNPRVLSNVVLGAGSEPYSKYLNFDKGVVGLFLLGLYAPDLPALDQGAAHVVGFLWRFVVLTAVVLLLALALGYVRWDPKLPSWWPVWTWSMLFLTALPEEAIFRGLAQTAIWRRLGATRSATIIAIVAAGTLFGAAHAAGGYGYVVLATAAGIGYGWIYAASGSIGAAILAHAALNTVHFLLFSYPALSATTLPGMGAS
jgi:membrane protease YdiL (CAAX protease family)